VYPFAFWVGDPVYRWLRAARQDSHAHIFL